MSKPYVIEGDQEDIMGVLPLLERFSRESPLEGLDKYFHPKAATNLIYNALFNGVIYVAKDDDKIVGVIAGVKSLNPFTISAIQLQEVCWYVDPEYRNGTVAMRLYKRYVEHAKWLLEERQITGCSMTTLSNTPPSVDKLILKDFIMTETNYMMMEKIP